VNNSSLFACGTYELIESQGNRRGRLLLYSCVESSSTISLIASVDTPGILDIKWLQSARVLATADASGSISLYGLCDAETLKPQWQPLQQSAAPEKNSALCLSIDCRHSDQSDPMIVSSDSKGNLALWQLQSSSRLVSSRQWKAHELETWVVAFDAFDAAVVMSGADDGLLLFWDSRTPLNQPCFRKQHDAGVTSIESSTKQPHFVVVGSYEERLYVWDRRMMRNWLHRSEKLGGGIWRIKHHPSDRSVVATANMQGGYAIHRYKEDGFETIARFHQPHTSIAYGIGWNRSGTRVVTASFYDKLLSVWDVVVV